MSKSIIDDLIFDQARKRALKIFQEEIEKYTAKIQETDKDLYINLFNSGVMVNLKKAGEAALTIAAKVLKKERKKKV